MHPVNGIFCSQLLCENMPLTEKKILLSLGYIQNSEELSTLNGPIRQGMAQTASGNN